MKKILALVVLLISFQIFGVTYSVKKRADVRMSEQEMKEEGRKIEKEIKNFFSQATIRSLAEEEKNKTDGRFEDNIILDYVGELLGLVFESSKIEIKEINYVSPVLAELEVEVAIPKMGSVDKKEAERRLQGLIKKNLGYSLEDIENNIPKKEAEKIYMSIIPYYKEILKEELKKVKEYNKDIMTFPINKVNNMWKMDISNLF